MRILINAVLGGIFGLLLAASFGVGFNTCTFWLLMIPFSAIASLIVAMI